MKRIVIAGLPLLLGCLSSGISTPEQAATLQDFERGLERIRAESRIPGMGAAIGRDDRVIWSSGLGVADIQTNTPVNAGTTFHAASLTKTLAATVLLQLVQQGRISLDDPVTKYGLALGNNVLIKHLLSMTSENQPGEVFRYNGNRFGMLDAVILAASGRTFARLMMDSVVTPLGLTSTAPNIANRNAFAASGLDSAQFAARLASPYALERGRIVRTSYPPYFGTAAGLISSATDLAHFGLALNNGRLLEPASIARMFEPTVNSRGDTLPYALGWFSQHYRGERVVWAYGLWTGNSSLLINVPRLRLTFVVLANSDQLSAPYNLGGGRLLESPVARLFLDSFLSSSPPR